MSTLKSATSLLKRFAVCGHGITSYRNSSMIGKGKINFLEFYFLYPFILTVCLRSSTMPYICTMPYNRISGRVGLLVVWCSYVVLCPFFLCSELKKFYKNAHITQVPGRSGYYEVNLDIRKLKTPGGNILQVPGEGLALAVAAEWNSQKDMIQRSSMHIVSITTIIMVSYPSDMDNPHRYACCITQIEGNIFKHLLVGLWASYQPCKMLLYNIHVGCKWR